MTPIEENLRVQDIFDLLDKDVRLKLLSKLIKRETARLENLEAQVEASRRRVKDFSDLLNQYGSEGGEEDSGSELEKESVQGIFPNRMKENYKQLLLWLAEAPGGRNWDEIVRYCAENQNMDERKISFFVANYRSARYGLLKTSNGVVSITSRGLTYLRREGLLKDEEGNT